MTDVDVQEPTDWLKTFNEMGAILTDTHVVYTSGKHGSAYVNKDAIYPHTHLTSRLCRDLAKLFVDLHPDVVAAPVIGGVILSQWVAHHLSEMTGREVLGVFAEKVDTGSGFAFRRGYDDLVKGKRVLLVEDILNTGLSIKHVLDTLETHTQDIVGVGAICNRGGVTSFTIERETIPLKSLIDVQMEIYDPEFCPLCKKGVPINTRVGKGLKFLKENKRSTS